MYDQPDGAELLRVARRSLLDDLLQALPETQRYAALMCANAMAIAARESDAARNSAVSELARVRALYPDMTEDDSDWAQTQKRLNRRLADDLRHGRIEAGIESDVFALLMDRTRARLSISNPKYLSSWDTE